MDETFPTITPHDLRHTAASLAVSARANVKAVQRMLARQSVDELDVHADLFEEDLVTAVSPRQQSPQPQQPDVAHHQTLIGWRGR